MYWHSHGLFSADLDSEKLGLVTFFFKLQNANPFNALVCKSRFE